MDIILQDLRYALRMLWKSPGVSLVAILALTAGIGANTAIFSVVNAVLLRPLPYVQSERLVNVWGGHVNEPPGPGSVSYADFDDWRRNGASFERMAAWQQASIIMRSGPEPVPLDAIQASADLLPLLGVQPELGRFYTAGEDMAGAAPVAVISHDAWQKYFGGSPDVVGTSVMLGSKATTIVGVVPAGVVFPVDSSRTDVYLPIVPAIGKRATTRGNHFLKAVGRLRDGVSVDQANSEIHGMCAQLATAFPETNTNQMASVVSMHEGLVGDSRPALLFLLGAVVLVLLIACANVANLLFARATARKRELSIRAALGASRMRIVRQLLVESLVLSTIGATAGMFLAVWGLEALLRFSPGNIPMLENAHLDPLVLGFTVVVTLLTTLVAGIAPALALSRPELSDALKEGSRGSTEGTGSRRLRAGLVAVQFALSVMLLVGAGLFMRSFNQLRSVDPGFDASGVYTVLLNPNHATYKDADDQNRYFKQTLDALRSSPGVESAACIAPLPFYGWQMSISFTIDEQTQPPPGQEPGADIRIVSDGYFDTMRIPVKSGRPFDARDTKGSPPVVIINESFARTYFAGSDPLGQHIVIGRDPIDNPDVPSREVIGIVGDAYHDGLDMKPGPEYYIPFQQDDMGMTGIVVRGTGLTAAGIRETIRSIDRAEYIETPELLESFIMDSLERQRFNTLLIGLFAVVALLLATVGIYGVMAYAVTRRTQEIGIRMALGASAGQIARQVVGQGILMAIAGTVVGLAGAFALGRAIESLLFSVSATDAMTFAAVTVLLMAVALLACYIPARWAARVDPMVALRTE